MLRVALTGGIATGKSHVRALFEQRGVPTSDADVLARQVVAPGTPGLAAIVDRFGPGMLADGGSLDRRALGALVFSDRDARRDLEAIVHPAIRIETDRWFAALDPNLHPFAIADIPLLYETGRDRDFQRVIVTACEPDTQLRRLIERDALSEGDARRRIASQLPLDQKIRRAHHVIHTDGSFADTERQVDDVYRQLETASRRAP